MLAVCGSLAVALCTGCLGLDSTDGATDAPTGSSADSPERPVTPTRSPTATPVPKGYLTGRVVEDPPAGIVTVPATDDRIADVDPVQSLVTDAIANVGTDPTGELYAGDDVRELQAVLDELPENQGVDGRHYHHYITKSEQVVGMSLQMLD
jgi:hypothetical protein